MRLQPTIIQITFWCLETSLSKNSHLHLEIVSLLFWRASNRAKCKKNLYKANKLLPDCQFRNWGQIPARESTNRTKAKTVWPNNRQLVRHARLANITRTGPAHQQNGVVLLLLMRSRAGCCRRAAVHVQRAVVFFIESQGGSVPSIAGRKNEHLAINNKVSKYSSFRNSVADQSNGYCAIIVLHKTSFGEFLWTASEHAQVHFVFLVESF
mmetsp:Transcript_5625/g.11513  ORF Transcript_5625/g.11513 Transcript_5625/m.11513 type:complete len:210 (-) Transcript_5625:1070-1699(-)